MGKIAVIDRKAGSREMLEILLEEKGHTLELFTNFEGGVSNLEKKNFDAVFLDGDMLKDETDEQLKRLRMVSQRMKVIVLLRDPQEKLEEVMETTGAYGCLHKPINLHEFTHMLEQFFQKS